MYYGLSQAQIDLQKRARRIAISLIAPNAAEVDRNEQYPWDNVDALRDAGFMGMTIPKRYGGAGLSFIDAAVVIEEIAKVCGVTGRIAVEANMGAISAVMHYGTEEQRRLAAELVLSGDKPAICITEPEAGSAASEMTTRADKRGNQYVINGKKHWITGGGVSRFHLIFARVFDQSGEECGIGGFIAIRDEDPGLEVGEREPTMGLRGIPETEIIFNDLVIDKSRVLLPPSGFRRGFGELMNAYNAQRVGAGTVALGLAAGAYEHGRDYMLQREQFGRPIAEFQGLQWMLADMSTQLEAARLMIYSAARSRGGNDSPFPDVTAAAQSKLFASEMAIKVTNDALQLFGAKGYSRNAPLERIARDARMFTIGGGTAQILRTVIATRLLDRKFPQTRDGYSNLSSSSDVKKTKLEAI
ncbi:MAG TPA: acyl-CoA dehydrogenase [Gammaproteobacteria bacterium]|nr:acyl-CoA dehydrogenase [Gammaproteobacteria bacterium]|tara:strand:- start:1205 stop:2446 length:1242 start_codon:yes stop_codon:yes gene_type:complete